MINKESTKNLVYAGQDRQGFIAYPTPNKNIKVKKMSDYNCPVGSDTSDAPWNQSDNKEEEIEVTISITMSKTVKVNVDDYRIVDSGKDADGYYFEVHDYDDCDLKEAVESQIKLPSEEFKDWTVDDFEVIKE